MTKKVAFLLQNNYVLHMTIPAAQYVWKTEHTLIDRSSFSDFVVTECDVDWASFDVIIPFGSVQFIRNMRGTPIEKHMFFREGSFDTDMWAWQFRDRALNGKGFKAQARHVTFLFEVEPDAKYHVRPNSKDKAFVADVFNRETWAKIVEDRSVEDDLDCFISPVANILSEYRCWIIGGKVVEVSRYRQDGQMDLLQVGSDHEAWIAAQRLSEIYLPEECIVMDVAQTDEGYKFLEFNSIHSSGWYAGNIATIFDAMVNWLSRDEE